MDRMQEALALIASVVGAASSAAGACAADSAWVGKAQADLDKASRQVADGADTVRMPWRVTNIDPAVERFLIQRAVPPPSGKLDVYVDVVQSAQQGALYLNLGGEGLDLGSQTSSFVLRIEGRLGVREFSYSSGTTMATIAHTIRQAGPAGVTAFEVASGVTLQSERVGDSAFVRVRVIQDGKLQDVSPEVGIYRMLASNANVPDLTTRINIDSGQASSGVHDAGRDVRAIVNGAHFSGNGSVVWINHPRLKARIELAAGPLEPGMTANAQVPGFFRAFTIERVP